VRLVLETGYRQSGVRFAAASAGSGSEGGRSEPRPQRPLGGLAAAAAHDPVRKGV